MPDDIIITSRRLAKHARGYRRQLAAGHTILLERRGKVFAIVTGSERVDVDTDLIDQVRYLLNPHGDRTLSDRDVVTAALQSIRFGVLGGPLRP